jgi:hypothetical protein
MSKALVWIIAATLVVASLAILASAADVGKVIQKCDDMHEAGKTCNYGIKGNALVGCTESVVFVCPADGTRQCSGSKNTTGKCNEDGTAARRIPPKHLRPLNGDAVLHQMNK